MVTRTELAVAATCGVWAAAFLAGEGAAAAFALPLGLAVLPFRRRPATAALAVAALVLALFASGVSEENPATLAAGLTVTFALGRHREGAVAFAPVVALALALTVIGGVAAADAGFVAFVLSATWACGRLVRRRAENARRTEATAADLAGRDPAELAARVVAEERARLAGDALAVVRRAVEAMRREAAAAERGLDLRALEAVQDEGRAAVTELRRLLGLLRADAPEPTPAPTTRRRAGRARRADGRIAAALVAACAVDAVAAAAGAVDGSVPLALAFAAATIAIRFDAAAACLLAALPSMAALALDAPLLYGFSTALAAGLLAWSAGADGRPRALVALGVLAAVTVAVLSADSPGNEAILIATFALATLAGAGWSRRDREGLAAAAQVDELRAGHTAAAEHAVRAERLRLARELHDVASHAVGAMVLQAGAALAMRERDPDGARAAVRTVQAVGAEAMGELGVLFGLLDAGAVGPSGLASERAEEDLAGALAALAERMRGAGLDVRLDAAGPLPGDPLLAATLFRIVQEALTNAARHAPGSRVEVALAAETETLTVTVRDDGARAGTPFVTGEGGGFGLVGLAERVRALGGELAAGPVPAGGFAVTARLPAPVPAPATAGAPA